MKKCLNKLNLFTIFIICLITSLFFSLFYCESNSNISGFDLQTILTWNYAQLHNLVPFKDLFFPYGLLSYYKQSNVLLYLINLLIFPGFILLFYSLLNKLYKNRYLNYLSSFFLYIFIIFVTGFNVFNRYGVFVAFTLFFAYKIYKNSYISKRLIFIAGLLCSLIFPLLIDQGIYCFLSIIFLYFFQKIVLSHKTTFNLSYLIYFLLGLALGILPFLVYLIHTSSLQGFVHFIKQLNNLTLLAKTPFFSYAFSIDNIFTFFILFFSITYLSYLLFFNKSKFTIFNFIQSGLVFNIILLEQKSIVRSISTTITFVSFILLIFLIYDLFHQAKLTKFKIYMISLIIFAFSIFFLLINNYNNLNLGKYISFNSNSKSCYQENLNYFQSKNKNYLEIVNMINSYKGFNGKVFSYPGDPIFYVLFDQKQPYVTSIYEGSSFYEQHMLIEFLKENDINYVIINLSNKAIQDRVPNYVRAPYLLKNILNNFSIKDKVNNFLILKKNKNIDFFNQTNLNIISDYKNYLLNVNLGFIPSSEGFYKSKYVLNNENIFLTNNLNQQNLNYILSRSNIFSNYTVLLLKSKSTMNKNTVSSIKVYSDNNLTTTFTFNSCYSYCIINLSNIPLFYKNRIIKKIYFDNNFTAGLIKLKTNNFDKLW